MRVAAGAIARKIVPGLTVRGALIQMGPHKIDRARWDWDEVDKQSVLLSRRQAAARFADYLDEIRKRGSSVGAVIEVVAEGVPPGLGAPIYGKLDGDLAAALMGINAVKGVEIGAGFARGGAVAARTTPTRCAWATTASRAFCPIMPAAFSAAFRPASRSSRALRSSRRRRS